MLQSVLSVIVLRCAAWKNIEKDICKKKTGILFSFLTASYILPL